MQRQSVGSIIAALNQQNVHYLVVGGLAVVAHGYVRFTADVDLMLALDEANLARAVAALESLGYRPRAPVAFEEFIEPRNRQKWITEKGMTVFSLFSPAHPATEIDLFAENPLDFSAAFQRAVPIEIASGIKAPVCAIEDLIQLKSLANRPRDREDIEQLKRLNKDAARE
jgi:predicted nucleotidyltransferase